MSTTVTNGHTVGAAPVRGEAAGVPFLAFGPENGARPDAPLVVAWHLLDPPRSEAAFAAAVPLDGLDAWRVYLGLPLTGARLPARGFEELMRLGADDAVLGLYEPVACGAAAEFEAAYAALLDQLAVEPSGVGLVGGSIGAAVAGLVLAESRLEVDAAVLVSPLVQLRPAIDAMASEYGMAYPWSEASGAVAGRLDFVARADVLCRGSAAVRLVLGADDGPQFRAPAAALCAALQDRGAVADLHEIPGMGHALAAEPGVEPASQEPHAAAVDALAVDWLRQHLPR